MTEQPPRPSSPSSSFRTRPATPARPCRAPSPCGRNHPPIAESRARTSSEHNGRSA